MRITIEMTGQNHRRYGKPWIGKVVEWPVGKLPVLSWGKFLGDVLNGGTLEIDANPFAIVCWGQKDFRHEMGTQSYWGVVRTDGSIDQVTESTAKKLFLEMQKQDT